MPFARFGDLRLHYDESGGGDALFLLHGAAGTSEDSNAGWSKSRKTFDTEFRTIAVDTRGHGKSNNPGGLLDYGEIASDVLALADRLLVKRFHVAGMSDGAIVGLDLAMNHPERVVSLALVGCSYRNDASTLQANAEWAGLWKQSDEAGIARKLSRLHDHDKGHGYWRTLMRSLEELVDSGPDYSTDELRTIRTPTLFIAGSDDGYCNPKQLEELLRCVPGSESLVIAGGGHTVQDTHADEVTKAAMSFLLRHRVTR